MSEFGLLGLPTDELATFLLGAHNDPFRVLGAHRLADDLVIRVFRPDAKEVEIVLLSDDGDQFYPMQRIQNNGFFQGVLPQKSATAIISCGSYDGMELTKSCAMPIATAQSWARWICIFSRRGTLESTKNSARTCAPSRAMPGFISRFGRRMRSALAWSAILMAGMVASIRCASCSAAESGNCFCRASGRRALQIRDSHSVGRALVEERSVRVLQSTRHVEPRRWFTIWSVIRWSDAEWMEARANTDWPNSADEHLRSASRIVAAADRGRQSLTELSRTCRDTAALRRRNGLHPHRADAGRRASVRRFVGLSGDELLRADEPVRDSRTSFGISSIAAIRPASA